MVRAVRGAIQIKTNSKDAVSDSVTQLIRTIFRTNNIAEDTVISIVFSVTNDITVYNPAAAVRSLGFADVPLFCVQEAYIEGQMPLIIRVLVTYNTKNSRDSVPVYLNGAEKLRPDLFL